MQNIEVIEKIKYLPESAISEIMDFIDFLKYKMNKMNELTKQEKLLIVKKTKGLWANDKNIERIFEILKKEWGTWEIQQF